MLVSAVVLATDRPSENGPKGRRIFTYQEAEAARALAQRECKPLVLHFLPDSDVGAKQLEEFYGGKHRVPDRILEQIVIVLLPVERFQKFARELGVTGPGGMRTISAFDLGPMDAASTPTCHAGFR